MGKTDLQIFTIVILSLIALLFIQKYYLSNREYLV